MAGSSLPAYRTNPAFAMGMLLLDTVYGIVTAIVSLSILRQTPIHQVKTRNINEPRTWRIGTRSGAKARLLGPKCALLNSSIQSRNLLKFGNELN